MSDDGNVRSGSYVSHSPEETRMLGERIGARLRGGEVILLSGPLGAGKTTFTQGIARGLGIEGAVQSPSFVLERIHRGRLTLHHFDFYRLSTEDISESGLLEDLDKDDVAVIEWADRAGGIPGTLRISFERAEPGSEDRRIIVEAEDSNLADFLDEIGTR